MIYLKLFLTFLEIGAVSFGGGYGMISLVREKVITNGWLTEEEFLNMIAVSESTPGPIGINMATYVGFTSAGIIGSVLATLGFIIPSIIIVSIVSGFLKKFSENKFVKGAFYGLRAVSVALICAALVSVVKISLINIPLFQETGAVLDLISIPGIILAAACYFILKKWNPHPVFVLGGSAVVGILLGFVGLI